MHSEWRSPGLLWPPCRPPGWPRCSSSSNRSPPKPGCEGLKPWFLGGPCINTRLTSLSFAASSKQCTAGTFLPTLCCRRTTTVQLRSLRPLLQCWERRLSRTSEERTTMSRHLRRAYQTLSVAAAATGAKFGPGALPLPNALCVRRSTKRPIFGGPGDRGQEGQE